jgi:hypothetical protein
VSRRSPSPETGRFRFFTAGIPALCLVILWICGCAAPGKTVPTPPRGAPPAPESVLSEWFGNLQEEGFQGTARISLETPDGKYFRTTAFAVRYPASLRIEALPLFGTPDLLLAADGRFLKAYFPEDRLFLLGPPDAPSLYALFRLPLDVPDVVSLIMGVPPGREDPLIRYEASWDGPLYRADGFLNGEKIRSFWLDVERRKLVRYETRGTGGRPSFTAVFEGTLEAGGRNFPERISVRMAEPVPVASTIRLSGLERMENVSPDVFDLVVPPGAETRWLGPPASGRTEPGTSLDR